MTKLINKIKFWYREKIWLRHCKKYLRKDYRKNYRYMEPLPDVKLDYNAYLEVALIDWRKSFTFKEIKVDDFLKMLDEGKRIEQGDGYYAQECYGDQAYKIPFGIWCEKREVVHACKEEGESYSINLTRGSFPYTRKELIVDRFKFYKLT